ncbi:hypothetical protein VUR80DRAFT_2182 [Thermomyces stellatus]
MRPTTPSPRRDRDLAGSAGSRSLLKGTSRTHQTNGKKDSHSLASPRFMPLGEHVNGLQNRSHQNQSRSDKDHNDIYTFRETPAPQNGTLIRPDKARQTDNTTPMALATPSRMRAKRKRVATIDTTSDSDEVVAVAGEPVRVANGLAYGTESIRRDNQEPNGTSMCRQDSGLFARRSPALNNHSSEDQFDLLIYGQTDALRPPLGSLFEKRGPCRPRQESSRSSDQSRSAAPCLHIRMDPRIHWTHQRSEEWYRKKQEEIRFRPTRKENYGRAAKRMQEKRQFKALVSRAIPAISARHDAGSCEFGRHIDFGDVPEAELPEMVKSNPEWLKAAAWMRRCRRDVLMKEREIERRKKTEASLERPPRG